MLENILISYALIANGHNIYEGIEFNTLEDCEVHLSMFDEMDKAYCVKILTTEY